MRAAFAVATMGECTDALLEEGFELLPGEGPVMAAYMDELAAGIVAETVVSVPPTVTQALLSHLEASRQYGTIEQCLVRMDLASVDIHNTMAACSRYHLHDARIALQAYALMQPAAPLQDLLEVRCAFPFCETVALAPSHALPRSRLGIVAHSPTTSLSWWR